MKKLISFYQETLGFENYYSILASKIKENPTEFITSSRFLNGIKFQNDLDFNSEITSSNGDSRIDVPVWFGELSQSTSRVVVFGLEPRDTNSNFNIEKKGNKIYATPFGVDRWNNQSTVKFKPQNKYYRVFQEMMANEKVFLLFSDVVKLYKVLDAENENSVNDIYARKNFLKHAEMEKGNILKELELINPTHIITLGKEANSAVKEVLPNHNNIFGLRHPANGGEKLAIEQLKKLML